jgi:ribonuclease P protein component
LRFKRANRLKQNREFTRLKTRGRRVVCGCLIFNWMPQVDQRGGRLGVVTSRQVGSAVARSRARRLLREVWRRNQHAAASRLDVVLVARPSIAGKTMPEVERDYHAALRRAGLTPAHEPG